MGLIKSSIGIGSLLCDGIGDTLRVSLTDDPVEEIDAAKQILRAINMEGQCGLDIVSIKDGEQEDAERMYGLVRVFGVEEKRLLHKAICAKYAKKYQELKQII